MHFVFEWQTFLSNKIVVHSKCIFCSFEGQFVMFLCNYILYFPTFKGAGTEVNLLLHAVILQQNFDGLELEGLFA